MLRNKLSEYSQVFAVGDIHGCKDLLDNIHHKIIKVSKNREGEKLIIYLGDYVDRGPDIKGTIQTLIDFNPPHFKKIFSISNRKCFKTFKLFAEILVATASFYRICFENPRIFGKKHFLKR